jgi:hypothetical protein
VFDSTKQLAPYLESIEISHLLHWKFINCSHLYLDIPACFHMKAF